MRAFLGTWSVTLLVLVSSLVSAKTGSSQTLPQPCVSCGSVPSAPGYQLQQTTSYQPLSPVSLYQSQPQTVCPPQTYSLPQQMFLLPQPALSVTSSSCIGQGSSQLRLHSWQTYSQTDQRF